MRFVAKSSVSFTYIELNLVVYIFLFKTLSQQTHYHNVTERIDNLYLCQTDRCAQSVRNVYLYIPTISIRIYKASNVSARLY